MPKLIAERVSVDYGPVQSRVRIVSDVSLEFREGEFTCISGPSGSGKTSLLVTLGLMQSPTQGRIILSGVDTSQLSDAQKSVCRLRHLGFVFQSHRLMDALTALENVQLIADLYGTGKVKQRTSAFATLEALGLGEKAGLRPQALSGGERQRVAIARALVNAPVVLLADEPTASLDSHNSDVVGRLLKTIASQGTTVVAVTHNPELARMADRIVSMRDGKVEP